MKPVVAKTGTLDEGSRRKRPAAGEHGLDMDMMRETIAKAGLVYIDDPEQV